MLSLSLDAARATDGRVTPAVGGAIVAAGDDRDFGRLPPERRRGRAGGGPVVARITQHGGGLLRTGAVQLDLNGVVKGCTVDEALESPAAGGAATVLAALEPLVVGLPGGGTIALPAAGSRRGASRSGAARGRRAAEPSDRPAHRRPTDAVARRERRCGDAA